MTARSDRRDRWRAAPHASVEPVAAGGSALTHRVRAQPELALVAVAVVVVWTMGSWLLVLVLSLDRESTRLQEHLGDVTLVAPVAATFLAVTALCSWSSRWRRGAWMSVAATFVVWGAAAGGFFLDVAWWNL